ncbi:cupin-like domain-containing protein [Thalassotalea nanhaiensis]|uniref:cupin-like domain-containing protein n=1 Tax=Thalassotalea nanhaiensis TaxID=3065648 RepID=UPI003866FDE5
MKPVEQVSSCSADNIPASILSSTQPIILKGLVKHWPIVCAANESNESAVNYLQQFYQGMPVGAGFGESKDNGRLFYNDDLSGFNFDRKTIALDTFLTELLQPVQQPTAAKYVGSTDINKLLPSFREHNDLSALSEFKPLASIWLSNRSRIAAHHDTPNNIACCVAGKRRFTLFPPEEVKNLYIGPLDHTPAGQAISLVDFYEPDFERFPKFEQALANAQVAELEPGDCLFLPSMWWHHVEGLDNFNILINYWWQTTNLQMGAGMDALYHALLNIKDLPEQQKLAWQAMFEHYIFNVDENTLDHIPEDKLGILDSNSDMAARKIRAMLLNKLNR